MAKNKIGIGLTEAADTARLLNQLLATEQVAKQNVHSMHWLIQGKQFFELHELFGEYYQQASDRVDVIAERILQLGHVPFINFSQYLNNSRVDPQNECYDDVECIMYIIADTQQLLDLYKVILKRTSESLDEGTFSIMSGFIKSSEKKMWMLHAYLSKTT